MKRERLVEILREQFDESIDHILAFSGPLETIADLILDEIEKSKASDKAGERDDGPRRELAELIRSGLLGISPDSQELELEDKDWRLILDALGYSSPAGDMPGEAQTQEGGR